MSSENKSVEPCNATRVSAACGCDSRNMLFLKHHPFAIAFISFAILLIALLLYAECWHGDRDLYPKALKCFLLPGFFPGFIVGTIANSMLAGFATFLCGMLLFYGVVGSIFDLLYLWIRCRRKRNLTSRL